LDPGGEDDLTSREADELIAGRLMPSGRNVMFAHKLFKRWLLALTLASFVLSGSVPALAQGQERDRGPDYYKDKAAKVKEKKEK
jgi:hypothetical protein